MKLRLRKTRKRKAAGSMVLTVAHQRLGQAIQKMLLPLLKRKELDSKTFTNDEIILGNFKSKDTLPLANRGNAFVSLRGVIH